MAITAKFVADFSDFDKGVKGAEKAMLSFEQQADQVGGRLMDLGGTTEKSGGKLLQFTNQFQKFDSLMSAAGVNIGPIGRAITEIGTAASMSATSLGFLGAAGVAVGTAFATYNLVRWALDFTGAAKGLDDQMTKLWKTFLGIADGQAEAASKADVLARATINAKRPITDYTEAIEINRKAAQMQALQFGQTANATRESNAALAGWQRELREVRKEGNMEALNADLKLNMMSMEQLSIKYGITTQALDYYKKKLTETSAEETKALAAKKQLQVEQEKLAKSVRDYYNFVGEREIEHAASVKAATEKEAAALRAFYNEMGVLAMNAWKPDPIVDWIEVVADVPPAVAPATAAVTALGLASKEAAGYYEKLKGTIDNAVQTANTLAAAANKPTVGGSVAGMAPTYNQNLVARYGAGGYLGTGSPISITINGSVLGNKDEIARVVGDAVTSSYRSGGNRLPV